jgi:hypothetical protein
MIPVPVAVAKNIKNAVVDNLGGIVMNGNYEERLSELKDRYHDLRDLL